ncbi:DUF294 nucleotidyltransferase-like domain-containing protein [Microbulbifer epialgicus]|uniref:DUF294 nucleotidyltransferase-like domain-containing protein n=1 Tax=Microbulbifer epialgicus TaxID=393907 RepID=A0ABV4P461_9GAMM
MSCNYKKPLCPGIIENGSLAKTCDNCLSDYLEGQRNEIGDMLNSGNSSWQMMFNWSSKLIKFVEWLYKDQFAINGRPSDFSFCITGSGARREACPQSDLDAFIVVPKITSEQRDKWRKINIAIRNRLDAINNTKVNAIRPGKGFVFCTGGLNPMGVVTKKWKAMHDKDNLLKEDGLIFENTNTASAFAGLVEEYYRSPSDSRRILWRHIVSGLQECDHAFGNPSLHKELKHEINFVLGKQGDEFGPNALLTRKRSEGLKAIQAAVNDKNFRPPEPHSSIKKVKREIYRAPQFILKGVSWFYGVDEASSLAQLAQLEKEGKMHPTRSKHFRSAIAAGVKYRIASHVHTGAEFDKVLSAYVPPNKNQTGWLQLTTNETSELEEAADSVRLILSWGEEFLSSQKQSLGLRKNIFAEPFTVQTAKPMVFKW